MVTAKNLHWYSIVTGVRYQKLPGKTKVLLSLCFCVAAWLIHLFCAVNWALISSRDQTLCKAELQRESEAYREPIWMPVVSLYFNRNIVQSTFTLSWLVKAKTMSIAALNNSGDDLILPPEVTLSWSINYCSRQRNKINRHQLVLLLCCLCEHL